MRRMSIASLLKLVPTSCCNRSAKEAWVSSTWPSRQQPIKRRVALKIIKPGMDSQQVIARFEAERQALAMMDHPNIAKVLDAGTTESGRPYFVMELVKGVPITEYCDDQSWRSGAIGVVHPGVQGDPTRSSEGNHSPRFQTVQRSGRLYDRKPVPKVIDFGVAKAVSQELTESTLVHPIRADRGYARLHESRAGQI